MPNKLLATVFELHQVIEDLKGEYDTVLESLINNPDIGTAKFASLQGELYDGRGNFQSLRDRLDDVDFRIRTLMTRMQSLSYEEIKLLQDSVNEAKGEFASLKDAIDNAGIEVSIAYNDAETQLTLENNTSVETTIVTVPAGGKGYVKTTGQSFDSMFDVLVKDTLTADTIPYVTKDYIGRNDPIKIASLDDGSVQLRNQDMEHPYPLEDGIYAQEDFFESYSKAYDFLVVSTCKSVGDKTMDNLFKSFDKKDPSRDYYKANPVTHAGNNLALFFDSPQYVSMVRAYPYTPENTNNIFSIGAIYQDQVVAQERYIDPRPQGHGLPEAYIDLEVNAVVDSIVLRFGERDVIQANYFNALEVILKKPLVDSELFVTEEKLVSLDNINKLTAIDPVHSVDRKLNDIYCILTSKGKSLALKPSKYKVDYDAFQDLYGKPPYASSIKRYDRIITDAHSATSLGEALEVLDYPPESWFCARDINSTYWSDGGGDVFDGFGWVTVNINGSNQQLDMRPGLRNYNFNGVSVECNVTFPAPNLYRMEVYPELLNSIVVQNFNANGTFGTNVNGWYHSAFTVGGNTLRCVTATQSGRANVMFCVVPYDIGDSNDVAYSLSSSRYPNIAFSNKSAPFILYIYVGRASTENFINAITQDTENRIVFGYNSLTIDQKTKAFFDIDRTYTTKVCTKGWDKTKISISDITESSIENRYLLSFDEGITWEVWREGWANVELPNILINGLEKIEMLHIPKEAFTERLSDYIMVAVRAEDASAFYNLTFDTGSDDLIEINDADIQYCKCNRLTKLNNIAIKNAIGRYYSDSVYEPIGWKLLLQSYPCSNLSPGITSINLEIGARSFWRALDNNDLSNIVFRYFEDYMEIESKLTRSAEFKLNLITATKTSVLDKETGENLSKMTELIEQYKTNEAFLERVRSSVTSSINSGDSVIRENSLTFNNLMVPMYIQASKNYIGDYLRINALETQDMLVNSLATVTWSVSKYQVGASATSTKFTTPLIPVPSSELTAISVLEYCTGTLKSVKVEVNGEYVQEVINGRVTIRSIKESYLYAIRDIKIIFEYAATGPYVFDGYAVRFEERPFVVDGDRVKIPTLYSGQVIFRIPFTKDVENFIMVSVSNITQTKGADYLLHLDQDEPTLEWVSPDFSLDEGDIIVLELIK